MGGKGSGITAKRRHAPRKPGDQDVDRRYRIPRWIAAREAEIREHLGGAPSVMQESLSRRFVFVEALALSLETRIADGQDIEIPSYLALVDRLHGLGKTLGMKRLTKEAGRSLAQALLERQRQHEPPANGGAL